jgi:Fe-S-cluster containining protein
VWILQFFKTLPRFFLWFFVFLFSMIIYVGDRFAWWILRYDQKTQFVRKGSCQKTGMCCRNIGIQIPASWAKHPRVVRAFQRWYSFVHRFQPKGVLRGNLLIFDCAHLRPDHTCGIYPFRPKLCREYPVKTLFGRVELFKGCGFWFVEREKLGTFEEKARESEHQQERLQYLRQKEISPSGKV